MLWDVITAAARLLLWVILLGGVAPRMMFRSAPSGTFARVARLALVTQLSALVLWFTGQLQIATFVAALALHALGARVARLPATLREFGLWCWRRFSDLFADPALATAVTGEAALPAEGARERDDAGRSGFRNVLSAGRDRAARWWRGRHGGASMTAVGRRWLAGRDTGAMAALAVAALASLAVAALRALRAYPLAEGEARGLLVRHGWLPADHTWIADRIGVTWAERMALTTPLVAAIAVAAPVVFVAAWSGAGALRRLAPGAHPVVGAVVGAAVPGCALALGHVATLELLAATVAPWACLALERREARAWAPLLVALAVGLVHPLGGLLALAIVGLAAMALGSEGEVPMPRRLLPTALAVSAAAAGFLWLTGIRSVGELQHLVVGAPGRVESGVWMAILAALSGGWLILGGARGRQPDRVAAGRALGLATVALAFVAGAFDGVARGDPFPYGAATFLALAAAVGLCDIAHLAGRLRTALGATAAVVALGVALASVNPAPARGLPRDLAHLGHELVRRHLAWKFTVVAPRRFLPAIAGAAWFVDGAEVRDQYPATTYRYDPERPERIIGTRYSYVLVGVDDSAADRAIRTWLAELAEAGAEVTRSETESDGGLEVYVIERDPEAEKRLREQRRAAGSDAVGDTRGEADAQGPPPAADP